MVILTAACLVLGWWQIGRARGGNGLSFGYAIEWPAFAIFVVFVWYREIRIQRAGKRDEPVRISEPVLVRAKDAAPVEVAVTPAASAASADEADPELAEYNRLLAWLAANPGSRPADYHRADQDR